MASITSSAAASNQNQAAENETSKAVAKVLPFYTRTLNLSPSKYEDKEFLADASLSFFQDGLRYCNAQKRHSRKRHRQQQLDQTQGQLLQEKYQNPRQGTRKSKSKTRQEQNLLKQSKAKFRSALKARMLLYNDPRHSSIAPVHEMLGYVESKLGDLAIEQGGGGCNARDISNGKSGVKSESSKVRKEHKKRSLMHFKEALEICGGELNRLKERENNGKKKLSKKEEEEQRERERSLVNHIGRIQNAIDSFLQKEEAVMTGGMQDSLEFFGSSTQMHLEMGSILEGEDESEEEDENNEVNDDESSTKSTESKDHSIHDIMSLPIRVWDQSPTRAEEDSDRGKEADNQTVTKNSQRDSSTEEEVNEFGSDSSSAQSSQQQPALTRLHESVPSSTGENRDCARSSSPDDGAGGTGFVAAMNTMRITNTDEDTYAEESALKPRENNHSSLNNDSNVGDAWASDLGAVDDVDDFAFCSDDDLDGIEIASIEAVEEPSQNDGTRPSAKTRSASEQAATEEMLMNFLATIKSKNAGVSTREGSRLPPSQQSLPSSHPQSDFPSMEATISSSMSPAFNLSPAFNQDSTSSRHGRNTLVRKDSNSSKSRKKGTSYKTKKSNTETNNEEENSAYYYKCQGSQEGIKEFQQFVTSSDFDLNGALAAPRSSAYAPNSYTPSESMQDISARQGILRQSSIGSERSSQESSFTYKSPSKRFQRGSTKSTDASENDDCNSFVSNASSRGSSSTAKSNLLSQFISTSGKIKGVLFGSKRKQKYRQGKNEESNRRSTRDDLIDRHQPHYEDVQFDIEQRNLRQSQLEPDVSGRKVPSYRPSPPRNHSTGFNEYLSPSLPSHQSNFGNEPRCAGLKKSIGFANEDIVVEAESYPLARGSGSSSVVANVERTPSGHKTQYSGSYTPKPNSGSLSEAADVVTQVLDLPWQCGSSPFTPQGSSIRGRYSGPVNQALRPHGSGALVLPGNQFVKLYGVWDNGVLASPLSSNGSIVHHGNYLKIPSVDQLLSEISNEDPLNLARNRGIKHQYSLSNGDPITSQNNASPPLTTFCKTSTSRLAVSEKSPSYKTYALGDIARSPNDMLRYRSNDEAFRSASKLKIYEQAFIKRSNGLWTCAILADRAMQPVTGKSKFPSNHLIDSNYGLGHDPFRWFDKKEIDCSAMDLEECMLFVINDDGATKIIRQDNWGQCVRRLNSFAEEEEEICFAQGGAFEAGIRHASRMNKRAIGSGQHSRKEINPLGECGGMSRKRIPRDPSPVYKVRC